jgi:GNAT superfamily N-acetyltransferase
MAANVRIIAVSPEPGTGQVVRDIRRWCTWSARSFPGVKNIGVEKYLNLESACRKIASLDGGSKPILVAIGFTKSEVLGQLGNLCGTRDNMEVIVRPPRPSVPGEREDMPSCSLIENRPIVSVQNTLPALRKSLLREQLRDRIRISCLKSEQELRDYFKLRYRVWHELGYLPPDKDCSDDAMEVNFTDDTAIPVGAFDPHGNMIGCARLVFTTRNEIDNYPNFSELIERIVSASGSPCLKAAYQRPGRLLHPFDLLDAFSKFQRYYLRLVRQKIPKAEVSRVIVSPRFRHQGVGEALVDSLVSVARQQKVHVLFLACYEQHREFYERSGFRALPGLWSETFASVPKPSIAMTLNMRKHAVEPQVSWNTETECRDKRAGARC